MPSCSRRWTWISPLAVFEYGTETLKYLMVMLAYMGVMFVPAIVRFERYDVR
ncbi:MAG: hypothetical protein LBS79_11785 [Tannerella sp.]|nr:hypothetical protein [Tannerella sp.]